MIAMALMSRMTTSSTTIAAAVSALNSSWGSVAQRVDGRRQRGVRAEEPVEDGRARGLAEPGGRGAHEQQRRGLAEGACEGQDDAREDPGRRVRQDVAADDLPLGRAHAVAGLADRGGHGAQRLGRGDDHDRQHHDRERQAAGDQVAAVVELGLVRIATKMPRPRRP